MSDESAARKGKKAEYAKYGKVHNFEGHFALSVEGTQNSLKFWPHLGKFIMSLNMQSNLCHDVMRDSHGNKHIEVMMS